jgi:hypothetical protein
MLSWVMSVGMEFANIGANVGANGGSPRGARFGRPRATQPARRSREATADDEQSRSYLLNAAPHVLIVSITIIIWSAEACVSVRYFVGGFHRSD